jgi:hypothetical protein
MSLILGHLQQKAMRSWERTAGRRYRSGTAYPPAWQEEKEAEVEALLEEAETCIRDAERRGYDKTNKMISLRSRIQKAVVQLLHSFDCVIGERMEHHVSEVTDEFIRKACAFDPALSEEAVYQASRNVLIMNTFQMYLGKEIVLTPSVFAYSLLYPYTDNYLDAPGIGPAAKRQFNDWLELRLRGLASAPRTAHQRIVGKLVGMIEQEFDRALFPRVYGSLLQIHHAQKGSLGQQESPTGRSASELLEISVYKGGASVIADGYLVAGRLEEKDEEFIFNFGVVLQLIDDLQDLEEDLSRRHATLAGEAAGSGMLELFTDHLLIYLDEVMSSPAGLENEARTLMERGCRLLILEAVALNSRYYTESYLAATEARSPVRFAYLREVREKMRGEGERPQRWRRQWSRAAGMWAGARAEAV